MSVFLETNHLFLRNPRGGIEDLAAMKAAGFGAVFCNIGDHPPAEWQTIRGKAGAAGVVCGPWLRTEEGDGQFSTFRLTELIRCADAWGSPLIVNSEKELDGSGAELTTYIDAQLGQRDAAISMEAWPFASVEWWPLADRPVLPQLFLADVQADAQQVVSQWHAYGVKCVVLTLGAYGGSTPGDYSRLAPFGVYTADDMGQQYAAWAQLGTTDPCTQAPNPPDPNGGGEVTTTGKGAAASCVDAWNAWNDSTAKPADWRRDNPGEWDALKSYWNAAAGAAAPTTIKSKTGLMLLAIAEARRYADGGHA